ACVAADRYSRQLAAVRITPQRYSRAAFLQQPANHGANFGNRLRKCYLRQQQPIGPMDHPLKLPWAALELKGRHQSHRVEPGPIAAAGNPGKPEVIVRVAPPAMQENNCWPCLPLFRAGIEAAINDVVFREPGWAGRRKLEVQSRFGRIEFKPRWLAFGGNKIRPFQKFERFFEPRT